MGSQLDVSEYSQAKSAAKAVRDVLREVAERDYDQNGKIEVNLQSKDGTHVVYWEGGPDSWAVKITGGEAVGWSQEPEIVGFMDTDGIWAEAKTSFALEFGNY